VSREPTTRKTAGAEMEPRIRVEPAHHGVRVEFNGESIADSGRVLILREANHRPVFYFPPQDVRKDLLEPTELHTRCPYKGEASYWTIRVGDRVAENAVWSYQDPLPERRDIQGHLAFYPDRVDRVEEH
jgi:uncharacterized protein (DUF427 family)